MTEAQRWVTMIDVAEEAQVATITVSRVLRTPEKVKKATRERVIAAIEALGYVPDEGAGSLSSRRTRAVGALISTLGGSTFASTIDGLSATLRKSGFHLLLANTDYSSEKEEDFISTMLARRPDGLILTSTEHTQEATKLLQRARIPVVEIWELPASATHHAVGFSNEVAAYEMVKYLLATNCRRIGLLGNVSGSDRRVRQRQLGYVRALNDVGINERRIVSMDEKQLTGVERGTVELAELLERWPDTDAVFCVNDSIALGAICEANRRGIAVPEMLRVAGFGDFEFASDFGIGLTTVQVPGFQIGELAAKLILDERASPTAKRNVVDVGFKIVCRASA